MNDPYGFSLKWFPGELNHDTGFHKILSAKIPAWGKLLDLGCGANDSLARYRTPWLEVWGTDFKAHSELKNAEWFRPLHGDGTIPFSNDTFDLVSSFMVMEHVASPARFFGEIARVLQPNGLYLGQSIHSLHYVTWIRRMLDLVPHRWVQCLVKKLYGREEHDTFPTRYRLNRRGTIARVAQTTNLEWVGWHGYASQGYFAFSPALFRLAVIFDWSLERIYPGLGKIYFTVILQKSSSLVDAGKALKTSQAA